MVRRYGLEILEGLEELDAVVEAEALESASQAWVDAYVRWQEQADADLRMEAERMGWLAADGGRA